MALNPTGPNIPFMLSIDKVVVEFLPILLEELVMFLLTFCIPLGPFTFFAFKVDKDGKLSTDATSGIVAA